MGAFHHADLSDRLPADHGWYPGRARYYRNRERFRALGLTADGKRIKRVRSGLSRKELGQRGYYEARKRYFYSCGLNAGGKPFGKSRLWTGLYDTEIGHTEYMRQYRALRRDRAAKGTK